MSPKEECEILMNELMPIGIDFLKKYREFYPYTAVMNIDGSINLLEYYDGNEFPDSKDLIDNLSEKCKQLAINKKIKACGIVWNTSVMSPDGKEDDTILVSLEHKDNYSVKVALPYKVGLFRKLKLGNLIALEGERRIF